MPAVQNVGYKAAAGRNDPCKSNQITSSQSARTSSDVWLERRTRYDLVLCCSFVPYFHSAPCNSTDALVFGLLV